MSRAHLVTLAAVALKLAALSGRKFLKKTKSKGNKKLIYYTKL